MHRLRQSTNNYCVADFIPDSATDGGSGHGMGAPRDATSAQHLGLRAALLPLSVMAACCRDQADYFPKPFPGETAVAENTAPPMSPQQAAGEKAAAGLHAIQGAAAHLHNKIERRLSETWVKDNPVPHHKKNRPPQQLGGGPFHHACILPITPASRSAGRAAGARGASSPGA